MSREKETITGDVYNVIIDGVEKLCNGDKVAVVIGADGSKYWTADPHTTDKDIRMLFQPEIVRIVLRGGFELTRANIQWMNTELGINTAGFVNMDLRKLKVVWVPAGTKFNIEYVMINGSGQCEEQIITYPTKWLVA